MVALSLTEIQRRIDVIRSADSHADAAEQLGLSIVHLEDFRSRYLPSFQYIRGNAQPIKPSTGSHRIRGTAKQMALLDFLHDWFVDGEGPIGLQELASRTGFSGTSLSSTIWSLEMAGLVQLGTDYGIDGCGSARIVMGVKHPMRGVAFPERTVWDVGSECWRLESDHSSEHDLTARNCLNCRSQFVAPSRFVRFCDSCKSSSDWREAATSDSYFSNVAAVLTGVGGGIGGFAAPSALATFAPKLPP